MTDDKWQSSDAYEQFMGRWSRRLARTFVDWLHVPPGTDWLDVGCGTGALTEGICEHADPASVVGCDLTEPFVNFARQHSADDRATFHVAGTGSLPARPDGYGCVASQLALNFFPDPSAAVREMASLARPDGVVGVCVWDYADKMEFLRYFWDAVIALDPDAAHLDEGARFPICAPDALEELFTNAGLHDVSAEAIVIPTCFESFDEYWRPFFGKTGPASAYVASLDESAREKLADRLRQTLPTDDMGRIDLVARAWAVRGTAR